MAESNEEEPSEGGVRCIMKVSKAGPLDALTDDELRAELARRAENRKKVVLAAKSRREVGWANVYDCALEIVKDAAAEGRFNENRKTQVYEAVMIAVYGPEFFKKTTHWVK
jgi:hypothetical protein